MSLMVKNFNKFYKRVEAKKEVPSQGPTMTKDLLVMSVIATIVKDSDTIPMSVRPPTKEEDSPKRRSKREESPPRERRSRDDRYE